MTTQQNTRVPQFFLTPAAPCPYLTGQRERKVFARLIGPLSQALNDALTQSGFRRSQTIAYRPSCDTCTACVSVRVLAMDFSLSRNQRRIAARNADLIRTETPAKATREQFALLRAYLDARHPGGGMSDMSLFDYAAMVEETPVETRIVEYRLPGTGDKGELVACALTDLMRDGQSMVYSFFHPGMADRSLGTYMILDHIRVAGSRALPYVYLGYWVAGSSKMAYKGRFRPLEALGPDGWERVEEA
jgi:leucyl-tRNA---protein transferase